MLLTVDQIVEVGNMHFNRPLGLHTKIHSLKKRHYFVSQ